MSSDIAKCSLEAKLPLIETYWFIIKRVTISLCSAKSLQSCPTLCNPIDSNPSSSLVPGIVQARTLEWVAISFSNAWKWKVKVKSLSHVRLFSTPWTAAYQAPPSMGFSRQEYWSGLPLPSLCWAPTRNQKLPSTKLQREIKSYLPSMSSKSNRKERNVILLLENRKQSCKIYINPKKIPKVTET